MSEDRTTFESVADELYSVAPAEFIARRAEYVARFKKSGDKKTAARIGSLRKPTVVAWMVNALSRRNADELAELFVLGDELEKAQQRQDGGALRQLSSARAVCIKSLVSLAVSIGHEAGSAVSDGASREIGTTLNAALADPDTADRVRAGRTVTAESYSGFGPALLSLVPDADDEPADESSTPPGLEDDNDSHDDSERLELEAELLEAREELDAARGSSTAAEQDAEEATTELSKAEQLIDRLRTELHDAEAAATAARAAERTAAAHVRELRRTVQDADRRVTELEAAVDRAGEGRPQSDPGLPSTQ